MSQLTTYEKWIKIRDQYKLIIGDPRIIARLKEESMHEWKQKICRLFVWYGVYCLVTDHNKRRSAKANIAGLKKELIDFENQHQIESFLKLKGVNIL